MKKTINYIIYFALIILLSSSVSAITTGDYNGNVVNFTGLPELELSGMYFNNTNWFASNQYDNQIYTLNSTGGFESNFSVGFVGPIGLVGDDTFLYTFRQGSGIYRFYCSIYSFIGNYLIK